MTFLPVAVLIRFLNPCDRFCLRLLFCAVVSDIVLLLLFYYELGGYYKRKKEYVKQKTGRFPEARKPRPVKRNGTFSVDQV